MKNVFILISLLGVSCAKKTTQTATCEHKTVEFISGLVTEREVAERASIAMSADCQGPYNIEEISQSEKRVIYRYSCNDKCN
jgi:hypothetical protein